tara:strand:+ start:400 stop:507 length:108 start_codon:yes stop_codon:yes gene_type:complete
MRVPCLPEAGNDVLIEVFEKAPSIPKQELYMNFRT